MSSPKQIGLLGLSMGGLLAPRAAAYEHRLAACVAVDGVYDLGALSTANFPGPRADTEALLRADSAPRIDAAIDAMMATSPTVRWAITHGSYAMGTATPRAFLASYLDYTLADGVAEQIRCPTLVCDAEEDLFFAGQPQQLYDHLTCPKQLLRFTSAEGAGAHCHSGAQRLAFARIYDWLDGVLAVSPVHVEDGAGDTGHASPKPLLHQEVVSRASAPPTLSIKATVRLR